MYLTPGMNSLPSGSRPTGSGRRPRSAVRKNRSATRLTPEVLEDRCLLSFLPAVNYATGLMSYSVAVADFNRDGKPDLVTANVASNTVSVLLGNGDGTFRAAENFAAGSGPTSVTAGDFNNDGKPDIVVTASDGVSVLLGNGDGTLQAPRTVASGSYPPSAVVGDFNGDGKLDLVVGNYSSGDERVFLGNGDGTFRAGTTFSLPGQFPPGYTGSAPVTQGHPSVAWGDSVAVGDLNNDGKLDLVVLGETAVPTGYYSYYGYPIERTNGYVNVLLGNGDGTFATASTTLTNASSLSAVAVGDFNGDGKTDVVTTGWDTGSAGMLLGNGDGTLQSPTYVAVGAQPHAITVGDFNGDGKLDLATADHGSGDVSVLVGNGDGTFQQALTYPTPYCSEAAVVGDFNGDGHPDLAVANSNPDTAANNLSVLVNANDWSTPPNADPATFVVSGFPSPTTAGVAGTFTVAAKNADGTTATGYNGTVTFTVSSGFAPENYNFTPADQGVHTFSMTFEQAGTQWITVTDARKAGVTGTDAGITVDAAAANHLLISPLNSSAVAGQPFGIDVQAVDPYGNLATGYSGTLHFTSSDPQAILPPNYTFTASDNGAHTFNPTLETSGLQSVTATDTTDSALTGTPLVMAVTSAAASTLTVAGFPSPTTAGIAGNFTVTIRDPYGNVATGYTGRVHFTSSDGKASLPGDYSFGAADAGVHTFGATLRTAGTQSISVNDTKTPGITGTQAGITVTPAAASRLVFIAPTSVTAGVPFSLTVEVEDAYGNIVTGSVGTVHFSSTESSATLPADYTFTAADSGVHIFTGLVLRKRSKRTTITVTDTLNSSLTGSVNETVT